MQRSFFRTAGLLAGLGLAPAAMAQASGPNIIHIFADDLGWGSVGFNNASTFIQTPNLDMLAAGGMILNRSYASTVCSPSRANLYTGTHNGHADNDRNGNIGNGLRAQDVTTGEILQSAGYNTAVMGKWGWGADAPNRNITTNPTNWGNDGVPSLGSDQAGDLPNFQGFDTFYGYLNHTAAHDYHYDWIWQTDSNGNMIKVANNAGPSGTPQYVQDLVNLQSEQYIKDMASQSQSFYMQVNYTTVHNDLDAIQYTPALTNLDGEIIGPAGQGIYASNGSLTNVQKNYAAMITRMDTQIGALFDRLRDPNGDGNESDSILDNTLVMFSSDNGATPEDGFGSGNTNSLAISGGQRGGKRDLYEGGIRMPALAYWNGTITPGTTTDLLNDLADVQATAADLAGVLPRVGIDGVSILPTLTGQGEQRLRKGLLFENFENSQTGNPNTRWTIIVGDMKLVRRADGVNELYNVASDPDESSPLNLAANAALVAELEALALAEGAGQADGYSTSYRDWVGGDGDSITNAASWEVTSIGGASGTPDGTWSALLAGASSDDETAYASGNVQTLGIEIAGLNGHTQTLILQPNASLDGRNEVRINHGGRVVLQQASLTTARWIDVLSGGELAGHGDLAGDVYNQGIVAPGQPADIADAPPADPPNDFTDTPSTLLVFNFSGVQDNNGGSSPTGTALTQTTTLDPSLTIVSGFQIGPGLEYRSPAQGIDGTNVGNEYDISGYNATNLSGSISSDNYVGFTVAPVAGLEMLLDEVSFSFWRNGTNAPSSYAILTSIDGFTSADALASTTILHAGEGGPNQGNPATLTAQYNGGTWVSQLEVRLYGWGNGSATGNTHFTAASLAGHFRLGGGGGGGPQPTLNLTGSLNLDGTFTQYAGSELRIDLGGTDNTDPLQEEFDQLNVTGEVRLAGGLSLAVVEDYSPTLGDVVAIVTGLSVTGQFETVSGITTAGPGLAFAVLYAPSAVFVRTSLHGDLDFDNDVDDADFGLAFAGFTGPGGLSGGWLDGDLDGDGDTDDADFGIAFANFTGPGGSTHVPEPTSLAVLAIGAMVVSRRRR